MADKPLKINEHAIRTSAQGSVRPVLHIEFQSLPITLAAGEAVNVSGFSVVTAYNESGGAAAALAHVVEDGTPIPLLTAEATVVSVPDDTVMPISVLGVVYLQFDAVVIIVAAG